MKLTGFEINCRKIRISTYRNLALLANLATCAAGDKIQNASLNLINP